MKTVELKELLGDVWEKSYEEQYSIVMKAIEEGRIEPVKASGLNGKKPALHKKYRILKNDIGENEREKSLKVELLYGLSPTISPDYYLTHLGQYEEDREWVRQINEYLKNRRALLSEKESANERSFEIWKREKFLIKGQGKTLLKRMGIPVEALNLYETTEPLAYYSHTKSLPQNILILENKDTFYSMRRSLLEGETRILDMEIGTLIYGGGKAILRSFKDFSFCMEPYMNHEHNAIYYFGDLDYEGIGIYENLYRRFEEQCVIRPMVRAYKAMLQKAGDIKDLPDTKEGQNRRCGEVFFDFFGEEDRRRMKEILEAEKYIPQEILSAWDWKKPLEGENDYAAGLGKETYIRWNSNF